ncbi:hypothetical protein KR084_001010, partial [Drosophila pseudotakahashii]
HLALQLNETIYLSVLGTETIEELNAVATKGVKDMVDKYKHLSVGNTEFSQWIKKLDNASKSSPMEEKFKVRSQFDIYNERRQDLEDRITNRINTIDDLIKKLLVENTKKSKKCLGFYQRQKRSLQKAYAFSNVTKRTNLLHNKKQCQPENESNESTEEHDEYSYY